MNRYAVIGHPVGHSLSPRIHAAFAEAVGEVLSYEAIDIAPADFPQRLAALHAAGYLGLNVTVPHKQVAAEVAERLGDRAHHAGAANTLLRTDDGWAADNTDGLGLVADLRGNLQLQLQDKRIAVIGAGGAARGIIAPLLETRPASVTLSSRSLDKARKLAEGFAVLGSVVPATHADLQRQEFDLVINATSVGHQGRAPALPAGLFGAAGLAYDLNYGPAAVPFLDWAKAQGAARGCDGLGMLVEQAADAFFLWRGKRPLTQAVLAALRSA